MNSETKVTRPDDMRQNAFATSIKMSEGRLDNSTAGYARYVFRRRRKLPPEGTPVIHRRASTTCAFNIKSFLAADTLGKLVRRLSAPFALNRFAMPAVLRYFKNGENRVLPPKW